MSEPRRYYGKFRGTVLPSPSPTGDPMGEGRIFVQIGDTHGPFPATWARPCFPVAGISAGMFVQPPPGAAVWIEFEQGDPDLPIWTGCFYRTRAEVPMPAQTPTPATLSNFVLQTQGQNVLQITDLPGPTGGIQLKLNSGASVSITTTGIVINNGQGASISMLGNTVAINGVSLVVTG